MTPTPLTQRQREVLELVAEGFTNKAIAAQLGISESGARKHLEALFRHYRVTNRTALVRVAMRARDIEMSKQRPNGDETLDR